MVSIQGLFFRQIWSQRQAFICAFVSLCILFVFTPELNLTVNQGSVPVSLTGGSHETQENFALPNFPLRSNSLLWGVRNDTTGWAKGATTTRYDSVPIWVNTHISAGTSPSFHYSDNLGNSSPDDFQQACLLLDIPPPSL